MKGGGAGDEEKRKKEKLQNCGILKSSSIKPLLNFVKHDNFKTFQIRITVLLFRVTH